MAEDVSDKNDQWHAEWLHIVAQFAERLKDLDARNPWQEAPFLPQAMNYLITELWDRGYSQTQIREAFEDAVSDLPRYAADEETRL